MNPPITVDGELRTHGEVTFRIRPLAGPGSKGPHELAPESDAPLAEVRAMLEGHPEVSLRIECAVNPLMMGQLPDASWGAQLAHRVARRLVADGIDCHRLEAIGLLDSGPAAPAEKVQFFVPGGGPARPAGARADPCSTKARAEER